VLSATVIRSGRVDLASEYQQLLDNCTPDPQRKANIDYYVQHIVANKAIYSDAVSSCGVPWFEPIGLTE
jgi:lysozyme family protein